LVIEVISPSDRYTQVTEKVNAYLSDGVRLIFVIDPPTRASVIYSPDMEQPLHLAGDVVLDLSDVIPDFQIKLSSSLFEKLSNPLGKN
jgi:Uma2 family endonuclease